MSERLFRCMFAAFVELVPTRLELFPAFMAATALLRPAALPPAALVPPLAGPFFCTWDAKIDVAPPVAAESPALPL